MTPAAHRIPFISLSRRTRATSGTASTGGSASGSCACSLGSGEVRRRPPVTSMSPAWLHRSRKAAQDGTPHPAGTWKQDGITEKLIRKDAPGLDLYR